MFDKLIPRCTHLLSFCKNLLLPPLCLLCGCLSYRPINICLKCQQELPILPENCVKCASFLIGAQKCKQILCGACLTQPPPFDLTFALFPYEPPVIKLITQLKFNYALSHAQLLGELLADKILKEWYKEQLLPDIILPIPLHPTRLIERGFNQAIEIAKPLSQLIKIPFDIYESKRIKATSPQHALSAKERHKNMVNAFTITGNYQDKTIAILDDVVTTGSTAMNFAKALKQKGAKSIHLWCCARRG